MDNKSFIKRALIKIVLILLFLFVIPIFSTIDARSGCCSHHGGVCGCGCCDGTSLSATCTPYYPKCSGGGAVITAKPVYIPPVVTKKVYIPTPTPTFIPVVIIAPTNTPTPTHTQVTKPNKIVIPTISVEPEVKKELSGSSNVSQSTKSNKEGFFSILYKLISPLFKR